MRRLIRWLCGVCPDCGGRIIDSHEVWPKGVVIRVSTCDRCGRRRYR